jgi:DnaJ-class molecular chaperone
MGDLTLKVNFARDPKYSLDGATLRRKLIVTPAEAALGVQASFSIFGKTMRVKVPAGSGADTKLRLRGHGLPKADKSRGDMILEVQIDLPKELSDDEHMLYQQLQEMEQEPEER